MKVRASKGYGWGPWKEIPAGFCMPQEVIARFLEDGYDWEIDFSSTLSKAETEAWLAADSDGRLIKALAPRTALDSREWE